MTFNLRLSAVAAATGCAFALAACGGGEDALSDDAYFTEIQSINRQTSEGFAGVQDAETARDLFDGFADVLEQARDDADALSPPDDIEGAHEEFLASLGDQLDAIKTVTGDLEDDAPLNAAIALFSHEDVIASEARLNDALCGLQDIAVEKGIETQVGCQRPPGPDVAGDNPATVEGNEFAFAFDAADFTGDTTGIVLSNTGEQQHEVVLARIPEGAVVDEIIREPDPEGVQQVGGTHADPGEQAGLAFPAPLEPGRYVLVCFIPDTATGQPHAALGMVAEFTLE